MTGSELIRFFRRRVPEFFSGTLFPLLCPLCGKKIPFDASPNMFCRECLEKLPVFTGKGCRLCGGTIDTVFDLCSDCMTGEKRPWTRGFSLFRYDGKASECVHLLKYSSHTELAPALGKLGAGLLQKESDTAYDFITAIPLHWKRCFSRSYNQSELFAREISLETGIRYRRFLKRKRATPKQALMTRKERKENIRGAFCVFHSTELEKRAILLVDDVMTTGSTLAEGAGMLLNAGAGRVDVLVIARRQKRI